jgi:hypothetical protein
MGKSTKKVKKDTGRGESRRKGKKVEKTEPGLIREMTVSHKKKRWEGTLKKKLFSSYIKKFRRDQAQSHL